MSRAKEVAENAVSDIEALISEMFEGGHQDNEVALGRLVCDGEEIQVQLKVTRSRKDFIFDEFEDCTDS